MRTLVLNSGFEPMLLISWERAICLVLSEKAEVISAYNEYIRTVSRSFPLPSVIKLNAYVKLVRRFGVVRCTRRNIMLRDRHECQYCGVKCNPSLATIDHVIPRAQGGLTTWENVVVSCPSCNRRIVTGKQIGRAHV